MKKNRLIFIFMVILITLSLPSCAGLMQEIHAFWQKFEEKLSGQYPFLAAQLNLTSMQGRYYYRQKYKDRDVGYGLMEFNNKNQLTSRTWSGCSRPLEIKTIPGTFTIEGSTVKGSSVVRCNQRGPWTTYYYILQVLGDGMLYGTSLGLYNDGSKKEYTVALERVASQ